MRKSHSLRLSPLLVLLASGLNSTFATESRPNFVVVIADDCTHRDLGCYGGQARTPNIDRLAKQGMRFARCFQAAPMCSPTRHNLYTGIYPVRSGAYPNHTFVKDGTKSVVQHLKPAGYRLALSGKRHINPQSIFRFEKSGKKNNPDFEAIEELFSECSENDTPFCLFACSNEPHSPWNKGDASVYPPEKIKLPPYFVDTPITRQQMSKYLAEITYLDGQVGQCLELLEKYKLTDNTLFLFLSEQGNGFPFAKWTCYESGLQSGCIARWPGRIKPNTTTSAMVEYVDVLPTFLEAAGVMPKSKLDGASFLSVLQGRATKHKDFVFGIHTTRGINNGSDYFGIRSVRSTRYKYIRNLTPEVTFTNACTQSPAFKSWREKAKSDADAADKVKRYQHRPAEEFYDLETDPFEWNNLAADSTFDARRVELSARLDAWMKSQGDKGQETELAAKERQKRGQKKKGRAKKK